MGTEKSNYQRLNLGVSAPKGINDSRARELARKVLECRDNQHGGRPKIGTNEARVVLAKKLHADKSLEIDDICSTLRNSRSTFYRYVRL